MLHILPLISYTKLPRVSLSSISHNQPVIIHRTWRDHHVNWKMFRDCHQRWLELNHNVRMEWYSDVDCRKFMRSQGETIWTCYQTLRPVAFKADLFRLCVLYERGGIYVDAHTIPYVSLSEMLRGCQRENLFVSVLDNAQSASGIHNGFIMSPPRHPFLKAYIDRIVRNVQNRDHTDHVLGVTGPLCMARSINSALGHPENTPFREGWNGNSELPLYLFRIAWGPQQYVYRGDQKIMSKKHCTLTYALEKMSSKRYSNLWIQRKVFGV